MIRTCDADDVRATLFGGEPCGRTYDDVDHSTVCPHDSLPPKMTDEERNAQLDRLFGEGWASGLRVHRVDPPATAEERFEHMTCHRDGDSCPWDGCPNQHDDRAAPGCFLEEPF